MYKVIRVNSWSLEPVVEEINFVTNVDSEGIEWIHPSPGVTGYEGAELKKIIESYVDDKPVFSRWIACAGTLNKWDRLEIPMSEIVRYLEDEGRISVEREYGYIKKVVFLESNSLTQTTTEEEK